MSIASEMSFRIPGPSMKGNCLFDEDPNAVSTVDLHVEVSTDGMEPCVRSGLMLTSS